MPWGWECRAKLIKQVPAKPTERRGHSSAEATIPAPNHYEPPQIFCGNGYSKIKRSPAYTFGHLTKSSFDKPSAKPQAPMFNIRGLGRNGPFRLTYGVVSPQIEPPLDKLKVPGPGTYAPRAEVRCKRAPAYSIRPAARPPYQPWDQWTPSPNMYCPPIPCKNPPAYTLGYPVRNLTQVALLGPGEHDPIYKQVEKNKPAYSFGAPARSIPPPIGPAPNTYCEKKFMVSKRTMPAPSFGIRHTPYIGKEAVYIKSSKLDLLTVDK